MLELMAEVAKRKTLPTGVYNGGYTAKGDSSDFTSSDSEQEDSNTTVYEQQYVEQEMARYATMNKFQEKKELNSLTDVDGEDVPKTFETSTYSHSNFSIPPNKAALPIDSFREQILHLIDVNNVVIIQGETGCGKSTQVPQYILDECREKNGWCNVVITQPRKIAAITVAKRVCEERAWSLGTVCGYQIALERRTSPDSLITYMTTGVLLQKIIMAQSLNAFSHIIIDEVHERSQELEFLLLVIRKYLFTHSPHTKVILMSATIMAKEFAYYFRSKNYSGEAMAPIITIDKHSIYNKQVSYIDQLQSITNLPIYDRAKPEISMEMWNAFLYILRAFDRIDECKPAGLHNPIGSVLVFLPGLGEIEEANKKLISERSTGNDIRWDIIPLHSSLPNDEQVKVFKPPRTGYRKVILSTNIAESSITVPDIEYVIDFCLSKVLTLDPITKYSCLQLEWATHVNCEQRTGRVGRVANGRIYRLVPQAFYENCMDAKAIPEIQRAPLETVVLKAKLLNLQNTPKQILALAMSPPVLKNIDSTIWALKEVGGLLQTCRGMRTDCDGDLTFIGEVMSSLPLDVRLSKLIVLGHMFSCLDEAIIIAAGCSIQNIFSIPFQQRFLAYKKLLLWSDGTCSDAITLLNLYNVWICYSRENHFENSQQRQNWCKQNFVNLKGMKEWGLLITELQNRLQSYNIVNNSGRNGLRINAQEKPTILKVLTCGAFYPNFFTRSATCGNVDESEIVREVGGLDPLRTVYLKGFDSSQPGLLYTKQIKNMFMDEARDAQNINVSFNGSNKVFIEFKSRMGADFQTVDLHGNRTVGKIPGKIPMQLYECIRKRQLRHEYQLQLLPMNEAWSLAEKYGIRSGGAHVEKQRNVAHIEFDVIPQWDVAFVKILITTMIDAGHFWCQHVNDETQQLSYLIERELNRQVLHPAVATKEEADSITYTKLYAARWNQDNRFYRCRVNAVNGKYAYIIFVDFGNLQKVSVDQIYNIPPVAELQTGPLAMECVLVGIKPALEHEAVFSKEANDFFTSKTDNRMLLGKVYSVVDDVVHLDLYYKDQQKQEICMNTILVDKGYAVVTKESFLSEENHALRLSIQTSDNPPDCASKMQRNKPNQDYHTPTNYEKTLELKGSFSPLEMRIFGNVSSALAKTVTVEQSSVNAVLLDSEPHDPNTRLVVAGAVHQSPNGNSLRLRQTTLMPNIPGLAAAMALLFCPKMEPKLLDDGTRVASILCGMGYHEMTGKPFYPLHDMSLVLDTLLTAEEINEINNLRFLMNSCIKAMNSNYMNENEMDRQQITDCQRKLKNGLFALLYRKRELVEPTVVNQASTWNESVSDAVILMPSMPEDSDDIWPLLWFVNLTEEDAVTSQINKNLQTMMDMNKSLIPFKPITCSLCDFQMICLYDCHEHLVHKDHLEKLKEHQEKVLFRDDLLDSDYD